MSPQEDKTVPRGLTLCVAVLLCLGRVATAQDPTPQPPAAVGARPDLNTMASAPPPGGAAKCGTNHYDRTWEPVRERPMIVRS